MLSDKQKEDLASRVRQSATTGGWLCVSLEEYRYLTNIPAPVWDERIIEAASTLRYTRHNLQVVIVEY